jgi:hypothetical protein
VKVFSGWGEKRPHGEILIKLLRFICDWGVKVDWAADRDSSVERGITVDAAVVFSPPNI